MTYSELINILEGAAAEIGVEFYHYTLDHANEYALGSTQSTANLFPVCILPPPISELTWPQNIIENSTETYTVIAFFCDVISPNSDRAEKQSVVSAQWINARNYVYQLNDSLQTSDYPFNYVESASVRIEPFFTYTWNNYHTAGCAVEFRLVTEPTYSCPDPSGDASPALDSPLDSPLA